MLNHPCFRHDVLIHDGDDELVDATRRFVGCGLDSGADVLVHGSRAKVPMLHDELGSDPRLSYGYDEEMYAAPSQTLFEYQRQLAAKRPGAPELWVTGTVPLGATGAAQAAWARYESAVHDALGSFPFQALCTYDRRTRPPEVLAAARATHAALDTCGGRVPSPDYREPSDFLAGPLARVPRAPEMTPELVTSVDRLGELAALRGVVRSVARAASAAPIEAIEDLLVAVHEVAANAIMHGNPPVSVTMWAEIAQVAVQIVDHGPGGLDPLAGYRFPGTTAGVGLWSARQAVDELIIDSPEGGGCRVLLIKS